MEIKIFENEYFRDMTPQRRRQINNCVVVSLCSRAFIVEHVVKGADGMDTRHLGEFNDLNLAELFARAYVDMKTKKTFGQVLREELAGVKPLIPADVYEAYTMHYNAALKKYKELEAVNGAEQADIAQIIVSANLFQRKLQKFIERNTHFLE